jgi:hypothetical protein
VRQQQQMMNFHDFRDGFLHELSNDATNLSAKLPKRI